jgi:hypothetical protein
LAGTELAGLLELWRETFAAKLEHLETGGREWGRRPPVGIVIRGEWKSSKRRKS